MRVRRVLNAAMDESTPRIAHFAIRNRSGTLPNPIPAWPDQLRGEVHNPVLPLPTPDAPGIPKIIFQTWKSRRLIPDNYRYWRQTFVNHNPDYQVILWDDDDNRAFITEQYSWFLETYNAFPSEIFRADAVRYFFMFHHGGFYADMDTECLCPIDSTVDEGSVILCRMGSSAAFRHSIPNAVMASRPGQLFWLYVIQSMMEAAGKPQTHEHRGPEETTGPVLLKQAYDRFIRLDDHAAHYATSIIFAKLRPDQQRMVRHGAIKLLDPVAWYPLDWTNPIHKLLRSQLLRKRELLPSNVARSLFPRSAVVTYWSHSW